MSQLLPSTPVKAGWNFDHSYARLPEIFYRRTNPVSVTQPRMVIFNRALARVLGIQGEVSAGIFAGNELPEGAMPIAQAYAGHQFGNFTTLGDGRAILLGEQITPGGDRFDIQLKGPGRTPFSRGGDGRAVLGPMLREYIISEAMHALGIPTTRSLAVVTTGEMVVRQEMLTGAVLTRVAASHIRVGTFEWAAATGDLTALRALADYTMRRHYADLAETENPYLSFLEAVIGRQAALIAKWQMAGFIHGVMNTDNMAISGETIDYGPCAFMDVYDPATVLSSIDQRGRYAYGNQPKIAQWNLARLAESLLPLLHADEKRAIELANGAIHSFADHFKRHWLAGMRAKLGLFTAEAGDAAMIESLLEWMRANHADFTNTFRSLSSQEPVVDPVWHQEWQARLGRQPQSSSEVLTLMCAHNPAFIPRNHKVEEALEAAELKEDFQVMERLLDILMTPYDHSRDEPEYSAPPAPSDRVYQTFCGT